MDDYTRPDPVPVETVEDLREPPPPAGYWTCEYAPTMNDDWHDDALCDNGVEAHRPYLREWDDFVTPDELMQAADQYAEELNAHELDALEPKEPEEGAATEPVWTTRGAGSPSGGGEPVWSLRGGSGEAPTARTWAELTGQVD